MAALTTYSMILGTLMARRWDELKISQQEFFERSGIATGSWSRIMRGQAHFQIEDIRGAARALNCQVSTFTERADALAQELTSEEGVTIATKDELKRNENLLPRIIAAAALAFLLYRMLK